MKLFQVEFPFFNGPLDLLLYLVRKHELDILDVSISRITDQYMDFLEILKDIDVNSVGDFLVVASTLIEIKSYALLPTDEEVQEETEDSRKELVTQLLAYQKFCDSAGKLESRARRWQRRYPRLADDSLVRTRNLADEPIQDVELWDLVSAFGRILREKSPKTRHQIVYDETPISVHMQRIYQRLKEEKTLTFSSFFEKNQRRSTLIGIFLAILELVRHEYATVEQKNLFGEIYLGYRQSSRTFDFGTADNYDSSSRKTAA